MESTKSSITCVVAAGGDEVFQARNKYFSIGRQPRATSANVGATPGRGIFKPKWNNNDAITMHLLVDKEMRQDDCLPLLKSPFQLSEDHCPSLPSLPDSLSDSTA